MAGRIVVRKSGTQFYFSLFAGNAERILQSEMYVAKQGALGGAQSVKTNAGNEARYERRTSAILQPYFVLKGGNGEIIGTSEMYSTKAAMEGGIASCKVNGPTAEIVDQSST